MGRECRGNALLIGLEGRKGGRAGEEAVDGGWIRPFQRPRERHRVVGDAISAADHRAVLYAVSEADAGSKKTLADLDTNAVGSGAAPADEHLVRAGIIALDSAGRAPDKRAVLIAKPD